MIDIDSNKRAIKSLNSFEWDTFFFTYFTPGGDEIPPGQIGKSAKRIQRLLSGRTAQEVTLLTYIVESIISDYFSEDNAIEEFVITHLGVNAQSGFPAGFKFSAEELMSKFSIPKDTIERVVNGGLSIRYKKHLEYYEYDTSRCLGMIEGYEISEISNDISVNWSDVFSILAANRIGRAIFHEKNPTHREFGMRFYLEILKLNNSGISKISERERDFIVDKVHEDLREDPQEPSPENDNEQARREFSAIIEINDFVAIAEQLHGGIIPVPGVESSTYKSLVSIKNKTAATKRHAPAKQLKDKFIKYYIEVSKVRKTSRSSVAATYYRGLLDGEKMILAPSKLEKNAVRTLTEALRQYERTLMK